MFQVQEDGHIASNCPSKTLFLEDVELSQEEKRNRDSLEEVYIVDPEVRDQEEPIEYIQVMRKGHFSTIS